MPSFRCEKYDPSRHELAGFRCEDARYEKFLTGKAPTLHAAGFARTYLAFEPDSEVLCGYSTITMSSLSKQLVMVPDLLRSVPSFDLPVLHLERLATDVERRRTGVATFLLKEVFELALSCERHVGCFGVSLHYAKDDLVGFYARFGFTVVNKREKIMLLTLKTLREATG